MNGRRVVELMVKCNIFNAELVGDVTGCWRVRPILEGKRAKGGVKTLGVEICAGEMKMGPKRLPKFDP